MFCPYCGQQTPDNAKFCANCGAQMTPAAQQPYYQQRAYAAPGGGSVGFIEAIRLFFVNYVNFTGRARRSEYWWSVLFLFLVGMVASILDYLIDAQVFGTIVSLGTLLPSLAISVRRLHDIGKSWPWIFLSLIPLAGGMIMIVLFCRESDGDNPWGPGPASNPYQM